MMKNSDRSSNIGNVLMPLIIVAVSALLTVGCKTEVSQSGGAGAPPSIPSPPGGGMPSPPSGGSDSGGSSGDGSESGGSSGGGSSGEGSEGGDSSGGFPTGGSESGSGDAGSSPSSDDGGGGGDVGQIPPPPSQRGASGGGSDSGDSGDGGGEEDPFSDADAEGNGDCGDSGVIPGGIGGMGQAGECIGGGGAAASESDSESAAEGGAAASAGGSAGGGGAAGTGGAGSVGQFPEESAEERAARLGRELDESIGGFDETLQEEQQEIAAVGRVLEGFDTEGGGGGEGDGSGGVISLGTQSRAGQGGPQEGGTAGGNKKPIPEIAGMSQQQIEERTPDDIPTIVDDDIIARQLREAALTEDDPQLRERLWDEYRKYRGLLTNN